MVDTYDWKLEINSIDVSEYVVGPAKASKQTGDAFAKIVFFLTKDYPYTLNNYQQIDYYERFGSSNSWVKVQSFLLIRFPYNDSNKQYACEGASHAYRAYNRTATNLFREDAGNGNARTIVTSIIDEYIPEYSYDSSTIPTTTVSFKEQKYQNKSINEVFDYIASVLGRDWWVDQDQVFYMKTRSFPLVSEPITENDMDGAPDIDQDVSKFANYVVIEGSRIPVNKSEILAVGTTNEVDLSYTPEAITRVEADGDKLEIGKEGAEGYNDPSVYDGYVKIGDKKIYFNTGAAQAAGTVEVEYNSFSIIHEEVQDPVSIADYGITVEKNFSQESIVTQQEAYDIGQNYLDNYSTPIDLVTAKVRVTSHSQITNWDIGNKVSVTYLDQFGPSELKIVSVDHHFGTRGHWLTLRFNDFPDTNKDLLKRLILKVKQREERERVSRDEFVKYFFWQGTYYYEVENISIRQQNIIGSMLVWGHPTVGTWGSFYWASGTTDPWQELISINSTRGFRETFEADRWFEDTGSTDATYQQGGNENAYNFSSGSVYQSKYVFRNDEKTNYATITLFGSGTTNVTPYFMFDGVNWEQGTVAEQYVTANSGTDGLRYKLEATSGTCQITEVLINYGFNSSLQATGTTGGAAPTPSPSGSSFPLEFPWNLS